MVEASSHYADVCGGEETPQDWYEYKHGTGDNRLSCDKGGHRKRSLANDDGQHRRYWNRENRRAMRVKRAKREI